MKAPPTASSEGENGDAPVSSPRSSPPILEVQEFPPLEVYNTTSHYYPHLSLTHHLYVYPTALKYDNQKAFAKVSYVIVSKLALESRPLQYLNELIKTLGNIFLLGGGLFVDLAG